MTVFANARACVKSMKVLLALSLMLVTAGCWDEVNLQDVSYVSALGVDYVDHKFVVYTQMISFGVIAKQEGQPSPGSPLWIGKQKGDTLMDAIFNLMDSSQYKLSLNHLKTVVIHERASNKIEQIIDGINRLSTTRFTSFVFGTKNDINDLFMMDMLFDKTPLTTPLYAPHIEEEQNSYIPPMTLQSFVREAHEPAMSVLLPSISISRGDWEKNKKKLNFTIIDGMFVFNEGKYLGYASKQQSKGLAWVSETFDRKLVPIKANGDKASIMIDSARSKVVTAWNDGKPEFRLQINLVGHLTEAPKDLKDKEMASQVEKVVKKELEQVYKKGIEMNADFFRLEHELYRYHNGKWKRLMKEDWKPGPGDLTIDVRCRIRRQTELRTKAEMNLST